jgi:hypothetical protein
MHNRKNWLFVGSDDGGERAAVICSLIGTALCRMRRSAVHAELRTVPNDNHRHGGMHWKCTAHAHYLGDFRGRIEYPHPGSEAYPT